MSPNFEHDYPESDSEWEFERTFLHDSGFEDVIHISKVGGGTVGKAYKGYWHWRMNNTQEGGSDLYTGSPKTHEEATEVLLVYIDDLVSWVNE